MSDDVHSQGYFGKLLTPLPESSTPEWDEFNDALEKHALCLNYEGTMIYSDKQSNTYDSGLFFVQANGAREFREACIKAGHDVDPVKHYTCIWYNGADSPMSEALVEEVFP